MKSSNSLFVFLILGIFAVSLAIGGLRWKHQRDVRRQVDALLDKGHRFASTGDVEGLEFHLLVLNHLGTEDPILALGHEAIPRLREAILSKEPPPRVENAIVMLGQLGPVAREEAPILLSVIGTAESSEALWALGEVGDSSPKVLARLSLATLDEKIDELGRMTALQSLVKLGHNSQALAQTLKGIDDLKDDSRVTDQLKRQCAKVRVGQK